MYGVPKSRSEVKIYCVHKVQYNDYFSKQYKDTKHFLQCCNCHVKQVDGVLPGRSNRQQSPAGPVNMRCNMRRCSLLLGPPKSILGGNWGRL